MKASSLQPSCVPWSGDEELENASCKKTSIDEMQKQSLALSGLSFSELESQLVQNMHSSTKVLASLQRFVRNNLEVKRSANYKCKKTDNPDIILDVLDLHRDHEEIVVQCLKTLRILARKVRGDDFDIKV